MANSQIATGPTLAAGPRVDPVGEVLPDRLVEGDAVGDYVIERFLGAGAMGDVYAGRHPVIGKRVAIKILKRELASDKEASERFVREAKAVNQIDHPNVIDVFNFGQLKGDDGRLFLVMDLVDGKSLRKVLEDGPLEIDAALAILERIAAALDAAHARGVIHRDLKPDNVMLSADTPPKVYVLDFGIAKLFSATATASGNPTLTGKGSWLGTPGYMAPEQWSAEGASPASDRYALGVMAYELIAGVLPFKAPTLPQMMEQHFRAPVPALSTRGTTKLVHHAQLDPVLARAMAKNPDERFPSATALIEALREAARGHGPKPAAAKRSLTVPAVAGVAVLGLGVVGALIIRGGGGEAEGDPQRGGLVAPGPDAKRIELTVSTMPERATVTRDGIQLGQTPLKISVEAGGKGVLAIRKPGYRSVTEEVRFDHPIQLAKDLQPILGFEGVWAMPDGKLRGFQRAGSDKVEVYRLESVTGERELWRTCDVVAGPAGSDLVIFSTTAEMSDERAHAGDAGCSNPHAIEYTYDPGEDSLAVRVERIETARRDGHCEVVSKSWREPRKLSRADRGGETRFTEPPVGIPNQPVKQPVNDSLDNKADRGRPIVPDDAAQKLQKSKSVQKPAPSKSLDIGNADKLPDPPITKAPPKPITKPVAKPAPSIKGKKAAAEPVDQPKLQNTQPAQQKAAPIKKSAVSVPNDEPQAQAPPQVPRGDSQAAK